MDIIHMLKQMEFITTVILSSGLFTVSIKAYTKLKSFIEEIKVNSDLQKQTNILTLRTLIVNKCEIAIEEDYIYNDDLQDILDMFAIYELNGGNSYVHTLVYKIRNLNIKTKSH